MKINSLISVNKQDPIEKKSTREKPIRKWIIMYSVQGLDGVQKIRHRDIY